MLSGFFLMGSDGSSTLWKVVMVWMKFLHVGTLIYTYAHGDCMCVCICFHMWTGVSMCVSECSRVCTRIIHVMFTYTHTGCVCVCIQFTCITLCVYMCTYSHRVLMCDF